MRESLLLAVVFNKLEEYYTNVVDTEQSFLEALNNADRKMELSAKKREGSLSSEEEKELSELEKTRYNVSVQPVITYGSHPSSQFCLSDHAIQDLKEVIRKDYERCKMELQKVKENAK